MTDPQRNWKAAGPPTAKPLNAFSAEEIKAAVANRYSRVALTPDENFNFPVGRSFAESLGYDPERLNRLPRGLWESFTGAGNPQGFVDVKPGESVLDLGCGAGLDLCLYAEKAWSVLKNSSTCQRLGKSAVKASTSSRS
jgi:hypothetical protein